MLIYETLNKYYFNIHHFCININNLIKLNCEIKSFLFTKLNYQQHSIITTCKKQQSNFSLVCMILFAYDGILFVAFTTYNTIKTTKHILCKNTFRISNYLLAKF